jgi:hypothetical protein
MDMKEFIADLERRAALIPKPTADGADECGYCRKPFTSNRVGETTLLRDYCQVCAELYYVVVIRRHFVNAQLELEVARGRATRLPDGDYFLH